MLNDLRYAVRSLIQARRWTAVVLVSLALGIGANLALFGAANGLLLQKIAVRDPDTLVRLRYAGRNQMATSSSDYGSSGVDAAGVRMRATFSVPMFETLRGNATTLSALVACAPSGRLNVTVATDTDLATGLLASGNYFSVLGVAASLGRTLVPDDDRADAPAVAVVSDRFWRARMGSDPAAVGRSIRINGVPVTVVGVLPASFHGIQSANADDREITLPLSLDARLTPASSGPPRSSSPTQWWVQVVGRLRPGSTAAAVQAELDGVFQRTARAGLDHYLGSLTSAERGLANNRDRTAVPRLVVDSAAHGVYIANETDVRSLWILTSVVALVLLIVCANVANLLLSRSVARRKEISIRLSLGATRARLVRQLLTESVLLASSGALLGVAVARWGQTLLPGALGRVTPLDMRMLGAAVAAALATAILFGLVPALRATRVELNESLKESSRGVVESRSVIGRALLVVQVAISLVILVGAGLFLRTLANLRSVDVGFNPDNLIVFRLNLPPTTYAGERLRSVYPQLLDGFARVAGVRAAALSSQGLLSGSESTSTVWVQGRTYAAGERHDIYRMVVSPAFFETMEIPVIAGRGLTAYDGEDAPKVAVINQAAARMFFGVTNAVGRRFGMSPETTGEIEVVGMVRDTKYDDLREADAPTMYQPYAQSLPANPTFQVRTAGDPLALVGALRDAVRRVDPDLPMTGVTTQTAAIEQRYAQERLLTDAYVLFGALALLVASIGLFGLMSYSVARRTNEIGIRMALGAQPSAVLRHVMAESMRLVGIGLAVGIVLTLVTGRLIAALLFGVGPGNAGAIAAAVAVLLAVSAAASFLPARRASRVDPLVALRSE